MSETTSSLEREAEQTRARIADTAETLRAKMTPGQMIDEVAQMFRGGDGETALVNLKHQVRDNPLPLALVGAGLAWLFVGKGTSVPSHSSSSYNRYDDYARARAPSGYAGSADYADTGYVPGGYSDTDFGDAEYGDTANPAYPYGETDDLNRASSSGSRESGGPGFMERTARSAAGAWDSATSAVGSAAESVGDTLSSVGSSAAHAGSRAAHAGSRAARGTAHFGSRAASGTAEFGSRASRGTARGAQSLANSASDMFNRDPLAAAALGVAVGALIGALLPRTRTEDEQIGAYSDDLKEQAKTYASEGLDQARDVAAETYAAAREEAGKQGLDPSGADVGELHLADRVGSVIKSAAKAGEDAARDRLNTESSDEKAENKTAKSGAGTSSTSGSSPSGTSSTSTTGAAGTSTTPGTSTTSTPKI